MTISFNSRGTKDIRIYGIHCKETLLDILYMDLVLPRMNLSTLDAGTLIMMQQVS